METLVGLICVVVFGIVGGVLGYNVSRIGSKFTGGKSYEYEIDENGVECVKEVF